MTVPSTRRRLSLGQQLRAARLRLGLKPKDVARDGKAERCGSL